MYKKIFVITKNLLKAIMIQIDTKLRKRYFNISLRQYLLAQ